MSTRVPLVTALGLLLIGGCASAPKYPVLGDWLVSSYSAPGTDVPPLDRLAIVGASATLGKSEARLADSRCEHPTYTATSMTAAEFTAQFKVAPASLEIAGDPIQVYQLSCGESGPLASRLLVVKDDETVIVPWDGMFYELTRRAVR